jgi:protein ImuA
MPGVPPAPAADGLTALCRDRRAGRALLWRAGSWGPGCAEATPTAATGWPALDAELPGGGWPLAGLTELLMPPTGGEITLLAPWLGRGSRSQGPQGSRELLGVAPPADPCAGGFEAVGLRLARWVWITPRSAADAAWSAEQALRSGSFAAVLWWQEGPTPTTMLRRLHLAAQAGGTPLIALRSPAARSIGSPAPLRLACAPLDGRRLAVEVFKRRGPPMDAPLFLALPWPASARRPPPDAGAPRARKPHAVDRAASAAAAPASPGHLAARA